MDIIHAKADGFCARGRLHIHAGLKRQDNTSTAVPHLLSKRTLCYQVSRIRMVELCYGHGIDPRELPCELIDPRYLFGKLARPFA